MTAIALVTASTPSEAAEVDRPLLDALRERGVEATQPAWDDPGVDWAALDLACVRTTWDYSARRDDFLAWAEKVATQTRLHNPATILRWNTHKGYLLELEERGTPTVPTAWLGAGDRVRLSDLLAARGWDAAVCKPAVGVGGDGVRVVTAAGAAEPVGDDQRHLDALLAHGDVLVQPYLRSIETDGELSVIVVDGTATHAVRKTPGDGEFRIHEHRGGGTVPAELDAETRALAEWVVESTGVDLVLARVDLIADELGAWQVVEVEATEPHLYLEDAPSAAAALADALIARSEEPR